MLQQIQNLAITGHADDRVRLGLALGLCFTDVLALTTPQGRCQSSQEDSLDSALLGSASSIA